LVANNMERQPSNVGNFVFHHTDEQNKNNFQPGKKDKNENSLSPNTGVSEVTEGGSGPVTRKSNLSASLANSKLSRADLNYSQEDIHALASKAEFLVLTGSNTDLRKSSSSSISDGSEYGDSSRDDAKLSSSSGPYSLDLDNMDNGQLSGTWEHDIQEQYISEGSVLGTWDNSMKSVLCFGEDYSNYIRRKSELPSLDIINNTVCGLQSSPRELVSNDVDPVILLRMSERDWLTVVSDLNNEQEQDTSFGDVENYERLIQTCDVNLDTLRNVKFSSDVTPKCLPQDHKDLIGTWEQLSEELREKLNQCLAFNRINKEIEIISLKIESITCKKETLDSFEEKEASMHKVNLQKLLDNLDVVRPDVETIVTDVHNLQSEVSGEEDKNVQKISLACFCKQEITSLSEKLEIIFDKVTNDIDECNQAIVEKNDLDKELAKIDKFFAKTKWISKKPATLEIDIEKIDEMHRQLCNLKSKKLITSEYFKKCSSSLQMAEKYLTDLNQSCGEGDDVSLGGKKSGGLLFSCMPVMLVTSAIMVYNYCSPVSLLQKLCRLYNVQEN